MCASPQLENGYTRIANEIIEALMRTNLSAYQGRIFWAIFRDTYGYHKKQDWISNSQLVDMTGIKKGHVSRTIAQLLRRNIVTKAGNKIGFNKDYTQWRELPKRVTVTNRGNKVTNPGIYSYQSGGTPKKKVLKKKCVAPSPEVRAAVDYFSDKIFEGKGFRPEIDGAKDGALVKRRLKKVTIDQIRDLIDFFLLSEKSQKHLTLSAALSADTYNLWMAKRGAQVEDPIARRLKIMAEEGKS